MDNDSHHHFDLFVRQRIADLKRISRKTQGEYQLADVENTAWLMAQDMRSTKGVPIDFLDQAYQERLLAFVYQEVVRYTETQVRHAIRLDHDNTGDEDEHPLMRTLSSNDGRSPLDELIALEAEHQTLVPEVSHSLAGAYAQLMHRFDNKAQAVADFLLISVSTVRKHCAKAIWLATHQRPIPLNHADDFGLRLRPWRRFHYHRPPIQLDLPLQLDEELLLEC